MAETWVVCDSWKAGSTPNRTPVKAETLNATANMVVPHGKWKIVDTTRTLAKDFEQQYNDGLITHDLRGSTRQGGR